MKKDTTQIVQELGLCPDFKTFYRENKEHLITDSLAQLLEKLLEQMGKKKTQAVKDSELSEIYAYQIFAGLRIPTRKKLLALAIGMELSLEQVQTLLRCAGYSPLYVKLPFDSIVIFGICQKLSVSQLNELLYEYGMETVG